MIKDSLPTVRQYTEYDSYSVDTDNRPIVDLITNLNSVADEVDARTGLLVLDQDGIIQLAKGCLESSNCIKLGTGVFSISLTAPNASYGVVIGTESTTPVFLTYSNKMTTGFNVHVFDPTGTPVDHPISVMVSL